MGTRHVRLDDDVYERLEARKHEVETFSEAIDRLTSDWSLSEFSLGFDEDAVAEWREAVDGIEETTRENTDGVIDRLDVGADDR